VLAAECDEVCDGRVVAAFDVGSEKLAALREAEGVDLRCCGEDRVGCEIVADFLDLKCEVAEEGCGAVGGGVVVDADVVDVGAWVDFLGKVTD